MILIQGMVAFAGRSPWRPKDPLHPHITAWGPFDNTPYMLRDYCLEYHAIFCKFNRQDFDTYRLPQGPISYRYDAQQSVDGSYLGHLAEKLIIEIQMERKQYTDFTVLKKSDFNSRMRSGLIILKYKDYPFILKLFLKTAESFVQQHEGIIPKFLFRMGGGTNRHLSGFTRIPNLHNIQELLGQSDYWSTRIDTPRKWYWAPDPIPWITIEGTNIGNHGPCKTMIPGIYGLIVDAIDAERQFSLQSKEDREFCLHLSSYLGNCLDSHVDNLLVEKGTGKIVIIDTEHFPTMVGLKEPLIFESYPSWYLQLSKKCVMDNFMKDKGQRRAAQEHPQPEICTLSKPT